MRLTPITIENLKATKAEGQRSFKVPGFPRLALRINYGGKKTWCFRTRNKSRVVLGHWPEMGIAQAQEAYRLAIAAEGKGESPATVVVKPESVDPFGEVMAIWLKRDQADNRTGADVEQRLRNHILPRWKDRPVASITKREALELLDEIAARTPATARNLHSYLHRLFQWCAGRDIVKTNVLAGTDKPKAGGSRKRVLSDSELALVWQAADMTPYPFGPIVKLLVLTGCRKSEIAGLRWDEIEDGAIHLPGDRTKNGLPHSVPLSAEAQAVIASLPHMANTPFVFSTTGKAPVSGFSKWVDRLNVKVTNLNDGDELEPWVLHDLRRSTATGLGELGTATDVVELALNHISGSRRGVAGTYQRSKRLTETAAAFVLWGRHISSLVGDADSNIVELRTRSA
jgi:integrase